MNYIWLRGEMKELPNGDFILFPKVYYRDFPVFILVKPDGINGDKDILNSFRIATSKKTGKKFLVTDRNGDVFFNVERWGGNRNYAPRSYTKNTDCIFEIIGYSNGGGAGMRLSLLKKSADLKLDNRAIELMEVLMSKEVKVQFSFEKQAKVLEKGSGKLKNYESYFEKSILPEIIEIEKRKITAKDKAYQLRVS